jgi:transcriptional regulator with XRE-family HTH domain
MAIGAKRSKKAEPPDPEAADLNQVVAYNFRRARELRGLTQDEAADRIERFLGVRLSQRSISAIERSYEGEQRREFDAQEILMFACAFDLPLAWFFVPPPGDTRRFRGTSDTVTELFSLLFGREDQVELLTERFRELGYRDPDASDKVLEGIGIGRVPANYRDRRKELLLDLVDHQADELDRAAEEVGKFFDYLRQLGVRGMLAAKLVDSDFVAQPDDRGSRPLREGGRPTSTSGRSKERPRNEKL